MAKSREGIQASRDEDQLKQRIRELEAEAGRLRAMLRDPVGPGSRSDAAVYSDPGRNRPPSSRYKELAEILDASADAIITLDASGMISRFNRGAETVFGYRASEIVGRPLDILIPERFRNRHRSHMASFAKAPETSRLMNERGEILGLRKNGDEFPGEASIVKLDSGSRSLFTVILRDVTERKEAETAIRNNEALMATLLDNLPAAIHLKDLSGKYLRVNREYERQFGPSNDEARGRTIREMQSEEVAEEAEEHDRAALEALKPVKREIQFDGPVGLRTHLVVKSPLLDANSEPAGILCVETDITERQQEQAVLREREAQLRQAQQMARIGTFVWDEITDSFEYCSDELAALLGYTVDEIMRASKSANWVSDRIHPDDRDQYAAVVNKARDSAIPYDVEFRFLHKNGHLIHIREMGEPELDADGRVVRTFCTEQDITPIRQAEETLRQSEALLSQSQRMARLGVYVWDNVTNMCVYCSEDMAALFGVEPPEFVASFGTEESYLESVHEADREALREAMHNAMAHAEPYDIEYRILDRQGELRHFREITEPVFDREGRCTRTFGTVQDITSLRKTQEALRQSEEQFRSLIEGSIQGVLIHRNFEPVFVNQALADIFGYDAPEDILALGSTLPLIAEEEHERLKRVAKVRTEDGGAPALYEFQGVRRDGRRVWLENRGNPVRWGGETAILAVMVDVTERKAAEQALHHREEQLRAITDNIPAFIVYVDRDYRYRFVNRLAEKWYARPAKDIVGQQLRDIAGDDAFKELTPKMDAALAGENVRFEQIRHFPDGRERHLDLSYVPDIGDDGRVRGFYALLLDISGRRRAEDALRRTMHSADLLRQIATAANKAELAEQALAQCLEAIGRHGGWQLADVYLLADDGSGYMEPGGLWWTDDPDDFAAFRATSEHVRFAPGKGLPGRVAVQGAPAWIEDIATDGNFPRAEMPGGREVTSGFAFPVLLGKRVAAVLEFFSREARERDKDMMDVAVQAGTILGRVIERQRAERALRDSEEQIRLMADNIPVLITYVDQDKVFRFANGTTERWYARPADEMIDQPVRNLIGNAAFSKMESHLDRALAGEMVHLEETLGYPDGKTRNIDATYVPHFGSNGEVRGIFTMVVDITDRIQAEEQLRHAQRMEAVGKLTGGVAHDFNNLLAVVMGNVEIVRDELGDTNPAVRAITRAAQRGSELTRRLLAFSRQQPLRPCAADLEQLIEDVASMLSRTLGENIAVEVKPTRGTWLARVDTGELENAILNLAVNARDAMPEGGTLTISAENTDLTASQAAQFEHAEPGKYVRLSVTDTGEGMTADVVKHAFEPFFTTKAFGDGSGLGLSMVYGFVTQSDGFLTIESHPGKGTTISLYLPRAEAKDDRQGDCRPLCQSAARGGTILVVEDDPDVRKLTVALLKAMSYNVLEAENGETALPLIAENRRIDLLLSDVVLTGDMSGPAIAEAALESRPDLRLLFMSGYADDVIRRDREGRGKAIDADLLSKPFTRAQLAEKVRAALEQEAI